ncbi:hypothetical protein MBLNU459_g2549t1 [Dothideomycetes sp. NU459]
MAGPGQDALALFRQCISEGSSPLPTTSEDASNTTDTAPLASATHLLFNIQSAAEGARHIALPLTLSTRFVSQAHGALDLLSVYFCWLNKDKGVGEYISATQALNTERSAAQLSNVRNLVFVEKLDLNNWLSDDAAENESEFIKSLDDNKATRQQAQDAADRLADGADVVMGDAGDAGALQGGRREEERLREIYAMERKMGDRNTVLRGIKPTDFSHVRKYTDLFLRRSKAPAPTAPLSAPTPALRGSGKPSRRPEPIILLSPSASSLLRLSNIKSFLVDGVYSPPTSTSSTGLNILHINRPLSSIDPSRPLRFILVETPDNFKPDYWSRVVAVFTTGQAWQFKGYKWQNPADLFSHALGVYVGWRNEGVPDSVKGWGRSVLSVGVDKWREGQTNQQRYRDRETVEEVWSAIENSMRARGWGKEAR